MLSGGLLWKLMQELIVWLMAITHMGRRVLQEMYEIIVSGRADMVTGDRLTTSYFTENKKTVS